jgi:NAD(P)-dependent dehydrogenase (short-subunit alcohol dehydrogenase family)
MSDVVVVIGSGAIGQAIARRVGTGKKLLLADLSGETAGHVAQRFKAAGFDVQPATVDVTSRASIEALAETATALGSVNGLIHSAGVSPSNASPSLIFKVDLYGTAVALEIFGQVIAPGGAGIVVSSQAGHRLDAWPRETNRAFATTPTEDLLSLPQLQPGEVADPLVAYQIAKRGASLRTQAESVNWAGRRARLNAISPGIVSSPLSEQELTGPNRENYQRMMDACAARRGATADEIASLGALLMSSEGQFISGSDFLIDGGVTAAYWWGDLAGD